MSYRRLIFGLIVGLIVSVENMSFAAAGQSVIETGKKVAFDYTLTVDNQVVDSSTGKAPLEYVHGSGAIIPGVEKALEGLHVGDEKSIVVKPEDGYGPADATLLREVPKSQLPQDQQPKIGMVLQMQSPEGQVFPGIIAEVKKDSVTIDFNHPLAGKTLNFQIKVIKIE